jgi:Kef-type K+ transport system membrane component KefB
VEHSITHEITTLVLQLAFIIFIARIFGEIFERFLKQPAVLGELVARVVFGPYLLGALLAFPGIGPLFPTHNPYSLEAQSHLPIPLSLYGIAQIASILLLFVAGLETNLASFLRFAGKATVVGGAGILLPFFRGEVALIIAGYGLTRGVVSQDMFGVAIFMTLVTTVLAPIFMVPAFRNPKPGLRTVHAN